MSPLAAKGRSTVIRLLTWLVGLFEPWEVRDQRRREARRSLLSAVDKHVKPRLRELGFASARTKAWRQSRFKNWLTDWGWIRLREDRVDLLEIYWDKYGGPLFHITFSSQSIEAWNELRWGDDCDFCNLDEGCERSPRRGWFGERQGEDEAVALALKRIDEMDAYLCGGGPPPPCDRAATLRGVKMAWSARG